jgi:hypothetical protein
MLPTLKRLLRQDVRDLIRISDAYLTSAPKATPVGRLRPCTTVISFGTMQIPSRRRSGEVAKACPRGAVEGTGAALRLRLRRALFSDYVLQASGGCEWSDHTPEPELQR